MLFLEGPGAAGPPPAIGIGPVRLRQIGLESAPILLGQVTVRLDPGHGRVGEGRGRKGAPPGPRRLRLAGGHLWTRGPGSRSRSGAVAVH